MVRYTPETMNRRDLRKCYSRFSISVLLILASTEGLGIGLALSSYRFLPNYLEDAFWGPILQVVINDISVYLPGLILFPLLLRRLPKAERIPVNRLNLWELFQAILFSFGIGYFFSILSQLVISGLEMLLGLSSFNMVTEFESTLPLWLTAIAFAVIAPVLEEIIFRGLLLNYLRGLGDTSAVVLSALAFALFHGNLYQTAYAFFLGMIFSTIVLLTGSIRDTMILHMLINGFSVLVMTELAEAPMLLTGIAIYLLIGIAIAMYISTKQNYHMEPGPLPFHGRDKRRACFSSVWFWLMLLSGLIVSVIKIFIINL